MALSLFDWSIVLVVLGLLVLIMFTSKIHMKSVADFLAAGRTGGRYMLVVSRGAAALGAITVVANFEMNLLAGFSMSWWGMTMGIVILLAAVYGWVVYRFRQTRCLTLAQFFEIRYSRRFRIFTGLVAFLAGIVNMGIFPAVEARFFIYFCGLPQTFVLAGISFSTFAVIMIFLLSFSLWFVFSGGQVTVMITDFLQGVFVNIAMVAIVLYFVFTTDWKLIQEALQSASANASLINPYHTSQVKDFNFWYFLIGVFGFLYGTMSWQGTQAYNASARNAHEAKMGGVLSQWRVLPQTVLLLFIPIVAYTVLNHPHFAGMAEAIGRQMPAGETEAVRSQIQVPLVLQHLLPKGLLGVFVALMLCASITNFETYLHSWGSILVQDVIMPLRRKAFAPKQHLLALRMAILFVAVFIFFFSLLFRQTQYILLFFALTGAIFAGGSGAIIIGGLYWNRGTTPAAWTAMIIGSTIAVAGVIIHQVHEGFFINGQQFWAIAMFASSLAFVVVSLLGRKRVYVFDRLLHRGAYAVREDEVDGVVPERGWRMLGMTKEFTRGDRIIYIANYVWTFGWFAVFLIGTVINLSREVGDDVWMHFWKIYLDVQIGMAVVTIVWFTTGGFRDLREMLRILKTQTRDHTDDGFVKEHFADEASFVAPVEGGGVARDVSERGDASGRGREEGNERG